MSKSPATPYPPDPAEDAPLEAEFGDLVDVVVADMDWQGRRALRFAARRVELRRCRLTGVEFAEAAISDVVFDEARLHALCEHRAVRDGCRRDLLVHG